MTPTPSLDQIISQLADEFCRWPLPTTVCVDSCAMQRGYPDRIGTNLLSVIEARAMFEALVRPALIKYALAEDWQQRTGNWIDGWGACKVCGGEIPYGHTNGCDIFKLEQEIKDLKGRLKAQSAPILPDSRPQTAEEKVVSDEFVTRLFERAERTITLTDGNGSHPRIFTRDLFNELRATGMLWELHPGAPQNWPFD